MPDPMTTKKKMLLRLREIVATLEADLSWIDPGRRRDFVDRLLAERDEALDVVMAETPAPDDLPLAERVLAHLRTDPADAARAAAFESWTSRARGP